MKKVIHISSNHINQNFRKRNTDLPVFHIGEINDGVWKGATAHEIEITGTVRLVYDPNNPLPVGARVWLELDEDCKVEVKYEKQ